MLHSWPGSKGRNALFADGLVIVATRSIGFCRLFKSAVVTACFNQHLSACDLNLDIGAAFISFTSSNLR